MNFILVAVFLNLRAALNFHKNKNRKLNSSFIKVLKKLRFCNFKTDLVKGQLPLQ